MQFRYLLMKEIKTLVIDIYKNTIQISYVIPEFQKESFPNNNGQKNKSIKSVESISSDDDFIHVEIH